MQSIIKTPPLRINGKPVGASIQIEFTQNPKDIDIDKKEQ